MAPDLTPIDQSASRIIADQVIKVYLMILVQICQTLCKCENGLGGNGTLGLRHIELLMTKQYLGGHSMRGFSLLG